MKNGIGKHAVLGLLIGMLATAAMAQDITPTQKPAIVDKSDATPAWQASPEQHVLHQIHTTYRERRGLVRQILDRRLCDLAQRWSVRMASEGSMYHSSYGYQENVAAGYATPEAAMNAWINSSGHRSNLLSPTTLVGFGAAQGPGGQWYWTSLHSNEAMEIMEAATAACSTGGSCGSSEGTYSWRPGWFGGGRRVRTFISRFRFGCR